MRDRFSERLATSRKSVPTPPPEPQDGTQPPGIIEMPTPEELDISGRELEEILSPEYLEMISGASGFTYTVIEEPPPGIPQHVMGFTNMKTKRIYLVKRNAALMFWKLKKEGKLEHAKEKMKGFLIHEGGHHAPEVLSLDQKLRAMMGKQDLEPNELQEYFNDPEDKGETKELFWKAFWFDVCNGSLDMWLEAYQSRGNFGPSFGGALLALHDSSVKGRDFLQEIPLHHQLTQWLVGEEKYYKGKDRKKVLDQRLKELDEIARKLLSPEVYKAITRLRKDGAIQAILDDKAFTYWGANTPDQKDRAIARKLQAVMEHVYPVWRKLLLLEFDQRKAAFKEQAKDAKPPLTDEEIKVIYHKILKELLDKTQQDAQAAYGSETPSEEEMEQMKKIFGKIKELAGSKPAKGENAPPAPPSALDKARSDMARRFDETDSRRITELADRFGVSEASLRRLQEIEGKYAGEIERLAADIAESFLNQRRSRVKTQMVEGMTTPGLEDIEYEEGKVGNLETRTHQIIEQAAEFLQTEIEHLFDTSGSMQGDRLKYAQTVSIILARVFERVKAILEGEGLLRPAEEDPLRSGFVLFTTTPERIKKLDEPTNAKSLAQMIEQTGKHSGGTDDAAAIAALTTEFKFREPNVLKFMIIYSDGEGNPGAVQNILGAIEKDKSIIVIVVAMGADPAAVSATYEGLVGSRNSSNIQVVQGDNINANLPLLSDFIKKRVREAAERLS